jgi:hypothetical protein
MSALAEITTERLPEPHREITGLLLDCASQTEALLALARRELSEQVDIEDEFRNNLFNMLLRLKQLNSVVCSLSFGEADRTYADMYADVHGEPPAEGERA